jgi:hypothetical protein
MNNVPSEFFFAITRGDSDKAEKIILNNRDVLKEKLSELKEPPLNVAIMFIHKSPDLKMVRLILDETNRLPKEQKKEVLNAVSYRGQTALHLAAENKLMGLIRLLIEAGIDYNVVDALGATARGILKIYLPEKVKEYDQIIEGLDVKRTSEKEEEENESSEKTPLLEQAARRRLAPVTSDSKETKGASNVSTSSTLFTSSFTSTKASSSQSEVADTQEILSSLQQRPKTS